MWWHSNFPSLDPDQNQNKKQIDKLDKGKGSCSKRSKEKKRTSRPETIPRWKGDPRLQLLEQHLTSPQPESPKREMLRKVGPKHFYSYLSCMGPAKHYLPENLGPSETWQCSCVSFVLQVNRSTYINTHHTAEHRFSGKYSSLQKIVQMHKLGFFHHHNELL